MDSKKSSGGSHFAPKGAASPHSSQPRSQAQPAPRTMTSARGVQPVRPSSYTRTSGSRAAGGARFASASTARSGAAARSGASPYSRAAQPQKTGRARRVISTILIVVGVALLATAAGIFIKAQLGYKEASSSYQKIQEQAITETSGDGVPQIDFDALAAINPDVVGWIYVPGTVINYPVVQTDNNSTYLHKLFSANDNNVGTIFMDMDDTAPGMVDQQTTIYGHHMNDGSMFKYIDNTLSQDAFDTVKNVYYITRDATYKLKPLYTMQVEDSYNNARVANFGDAAAFTSYLQEGLTKAKAKASDASERIQSADKVLTLVTCAGEIIPRTTRAVMVCTVDQATPRADASAAGNGDAAAATDGTAAATDAAAATTDQPAA